MKKENTKRVQTKFNEIRTYTKDPKQMINKYLAKRVLKTWVEDFLDEGTGNVISLERNEVLFEAGRLIDQDLLVQIQFFMSAGDIDSVEVSNQRREAILVSSSGTEPWAISARIGQKKYKIFLYAKSINMALEIVKDWIELNFSNPFEILQAKSYDNCILLKDNLKKLKSEDDSEKNEEENLDKKFYQIEVKVVHGDGFKSSYTFVLSTVDVDSGMIVINDWIYNKIKERCEKDGRTDEIVFKTTIESAGTIPFNYAVEEEFTQAYLDNTK